MADTELQNPIEDKELIKVMMLVNRAMYVTQDKETTSVQHYRLYATREEVLSILGERQTKDVTLLN